LIIYNMSQLNFRKLFGMLFTSFIIIIVLIFMLVSISQKVSIATAIILVVVPLAIRYSIYKFAHI
jgi:hypothetical protein